MCRMVVGGVMGGVMVWRWVVGSGEMLGGGACARFVVMRPLVPLVV